MRCWLPALIARAGDVSGDLLLLLCSPRRQDAQHRCSSVSTAGLSVSSSLTPLGQLWSTGGASAALSASCADVTCGYGWVLSAQGCLEAQSGALAIS